MAEGAASVPATAVAAVPKIKLNNGLEMPAFGLGTFRAEPGVVGEAVKAAIRLGYRHIDCAAVYLNEKEIGVALKELFDEGVVSRSDLWITSKLWNTDHDAVESALRKTVEDLQCEYLDLYLVHFPLGFRHTGPLSDGNPYFELDEFGNAYLSEKSLQEVWRDMEAMADAGLARSIGVSNFETLTFRDVMSYARIKPVVNQIECHPYFQNQWFADYVQRADWRVNVTAHTPLGGAKANDDWRGSSASPLDDPIIGSIAEKHGKTVAQVCIRWALQRGHSVIPKSSKPHRIAENFAVFDFELTEEDMADLARVDRRQRSNKSGRAWGIKFQA